MSKKTLSAKVSPKTMSRVEEYADEEEVSKSEATERLLIKGLDFEDTDSVILQTDGGKKIENQLSEVDREVGDLEEAVNTMRSNIEAEQKSNRRAISLMVIGFLWIATELTIGFSPIVTFVTGIPLAIILVYFTFFKGEE